MTCRAPSRRGAVRIRPQTALGTPAVLQEADGVRVIEAPTVTPVGEGRLDIEEEESPFPGGADPILGNYAETVELAVPIPVTANGELTTDHALVRLFRGCGCGVAISDGDAVVTALLGGCIGDAATERVPLTLEWAQRGGLTHRWSDVIGAFTGLSAEAGGVVTARFLLFCPAIEARTETGAFPAVTYPGQSVMLAARNAALTLGAVDNPGGLYSWEFTSGIVAEEVPDQFGELGFATPFSYQSSPSLLSIVGPQAADFSEEAWDAFFAMTSLGALQLDITGQAAARVLRIAAPRPFSAPQALGDEAGHRTDERELLLKPSGTTPTWTLTLSEQSA